MKLSKFTHVLCSTYKPRLAQRQGSGKQIAFAKGKSKNKTHLSASLIYMLFLPSHQANDPHIQESAGFYSVTEVYEAYPLILTRTGVLSRCKQQMQYLSSHATLIRTISQNV